VHRLPTRLKKFWRRYKIDIKIIKATKQHIGCIENIEKECIKNPWSKAQFEEEFNKDNTYYLIAVSDEETVGFCGAQYTLNIAEITNVAVLEKYRVKNIGYALVDNIKKELAKLRIDEIFLEVRSSNSSACKLYKKAGFEIVGTRKNYYTNPIEDALVMKFDKFK
jgi:ribosomal-protein-alanine N-acetyltransferase